MCSKLTALIFCQQMEAMRTAVRAAIAMQEGRARRDEAMVANTASGSNLAQDDEVAQVTVKLDWISAQDVQVLETGKLCKDKTRPSTRRQLEEARFRESEVRTQASYRESIACCAQLNCLDSGWAQDAALIIPRGASAAREHSLQFPADIRTR